MPTSTLPPPRGSAVVSVRLTLTTVFLLSAIGLGCLVWLAMLRY